MEALLLRLVLLGDVDVERIEHWLSCKGDAALAEDVKTELRTREEGTTPQGAEQQLSALLFQTLALNLVR